MTCAAGAIAVAAVWLLRAADADGPSQHATGAGANASGEVATAESARGHGDGTQVSLDADAIRAPARELVHTPTRSARDFGLEDRGRLDEAGKAAVRAKLVSLFDASMKGLAAYDTPEQRDQYCQSLQALVKCELAMGMLDRDDYLAVEEIALPKRTPAGVDPMLLFSTAGIDGRRVSVLLPVEVPAGSELEFVRRLARWANATHVGAIVGQFDALSIEERRRRIAEFDEADAAVSAYLQAARNRAIDTQQLRQRAAPFVDRQRPAGTTIDRQAQALRPSR